MHHFTFWTLINSRINRAWLKTLKDSDWQPNVYLAQSVGNGVMSTRFWVSSSLGEFVGWIYFAVPHVSLCWQRCQLWIIDLQEKLEWRQENMSRRTVAVADPCDNPKQLRELTKSTEKRSKYIIHVTTISCEHFRILWISLRLFLQCL